MPSRRVADSSSSDIATNVAIRISLALVFILTGLDKITTGAASHWIHVFDDIGLGQWFRYFTAAMEIVGGILCLIPITTIVGLAMLACTMTGAMAVHVFVFHHPADAIFPGAYLVGVILAFIKLRK
jgi:uncharacterized membrane protein YphA (DoxX/SURF4 family)